MILNSCSIGVLVGVGESLRWQSIHLLVYLGSVGVHLCELLLRRCLVLGLLEGKSLASKGLLQFGGLRVETIIVLPLGL